jgi:hypothetical protein
VKEPSGGEEWKGGLVGSTCAFCCEVPSHPLLALQRFTLVDLEDELGDAVSSR